eukprot:Rhum_TRINITY_DN10742_c0_g1::Rhum_TRINITY_DN10742_c0_g1_i1::g.40121::m.40121
MGRRRGGRCVRPGWDAVCIDSPETAQGFEERTRKNPSSFQVYYFVFFPSFFLCRKSFFFVCLRVLCVFFKRVWLLYGTIERSKSPRKSRSPKTQLNSQKSKKNTLHSSENSDFFPPTPNPLFFYHKKPPVLCPHNRRFPIQPQSHPSPLSLIFALLQYSSGLAFSVTERHADSAAGGRHECDSPKTLAQRRGWPVKRAQSDREKGREEGNTLGLGLWQGECELRSGGGGGGATWPSQLSQEKGSSATRTRTSPGERWIRWHPPQGRNPWGRSRRRPSQASSASPHVPWQRCSGTGSSRTSPAGRT